MSLSEIKQRLILRKIFDARKELRRILSKQSTNMHEPTGYWAGLLSLHAECAEEEGYDLERLIPIFSNTKADYPLLCDKDWRPIRHQLTSKGAMHVISRLVKKEYIEEIAREIVKMHKEAIKKELSDEDRKKILENYPSFGDIL